MDILLQTKSITSESDHPAGALALLESSLCRFIQHACHLSRKWSTTISKGISRHNLMRLTQKLKFCEPSLSSCQYKTISIAQGEYPRTRMWLSFPEIEELKCRKWVDVVSEWQEGFSWYFLEITLRVLSDHMDSFVQLSQAYQVECFTIRFNFMLFHILDKAAVGVPEREHHETSTLDQRWILHWLIACHMQLFWS